jgi:hypothetical protein
MKILKSLDLNKYVDFMLNMCLFNRLINFNNNQRFQNLPICIVLSYSR